MILYLSLGFLFRAVAVPAITVCAVAIRAIAVRAVATRTATLARFPTSTCHAFQIYF